MRGQLQAAKTEVSTLHDCVERQQDELEHLKRDLQQSLRQRQQLRDEMRRSASQAASPGLQLVEADPWRDQMKNLYLSGAVDTARKQQESLQEALHYRMRRDTAWEVRNEREYLLRSFVRAKQAVQEADELAQHKRVAWAEQRRQHVLRGEHIDAEARASRRRMQQEAEAAERQRLLREQLLDERLSRARAATMTRAASKPVLPALGRPMPNNNLATCASNSLTCLDYKSSSMPQSRSLRELRGAPKVRVATRSADPLPLRGLHHDLAAANPMGNSWPAGRSKGKGNLPTALPPLSPPGSAGLITSSGPLQAIPVGTPTRVVDL